MRSDDPRDAVLRWLQREGLGFDQLGSGDEYVLGPACRARFLHVPVLTLPPNVLATTCVASAGADPDDGVGGPLEWVAERPR